MNIAPYCTYDLPAPIVDVEAAALTLAARTREERTDQSIDPWAARTATRLACVELLIGLSQQLVLELFPDAALDLLRAAHRLSANGEVDGQPPLRPLAQAFELDPNEAAVLQRLAALAAAVVREAEQDAFYREDAFGVTTPAEFAAFRNAILRQQQWDRDSRQQREAAE
jgi:hypothetical protein